MLEEAKRQRAAESRRLTTADDYLKGKASDPYTPRGATREFEELKRRARSNWLPLVVDVIAQDLYVDGVRTAEGRQADTVWDVWQSNGLDARQSTLYRSALGFGVAYALVTPGDKSALIRHRSPLRMTAVYEDPADDEWPLYALDVVRESFNQREALYRLYDEQNVYEIRVVDGEETPRLVGTHGFGVVPVVRFVNRFDTDGSPIGEVEPLLDIQDRLNETIFGLLMAQNYSAFRQRWATGIAIPTDPATGEPVEEYRATVSRLWTNPNPNVKFGEFSQTDLKGYLDAIEESVRHLAAISQTPAHYLLGNMVNLSADALVAAQQGHARKVSERRVLFGESWEQTLRLAEPSMPEDAEIVWRDTEARSLSQAVDALGKAAQMLEVPKQGLWPKIPGITQTEIEEWKRLKEEEDPLKMIESQMDAQLAAMQGGTQPAESASPGPAEKAA